MWILLHSQSTVSVFKNSKFLLNIGLITGTLLVHLMCLVCTLTVTPNTLCKWGLLLQNLLTSGSTKKYIANILSMVAAPKVSQITTNTSVKAAMPLHQKDGTVMSFKEYMSGLYYYNAGSKHTSNTLDVYLFLNTVAKTKRKPTHGAKLKERTESSTVYQDRTTF
jgi:hypothetical protein